MTAHEAPTINLRRARLDEPAARPLLEGLAEEYEQSFDDALMSGELAAREAVDFAPPRGTFLLVISGGQTIAGGALAPLGEGVAEVKRMWTAPAHRREGHARMVLDALEREAAELGYRTVRLQTGRHLSGAVALYRGAAYQPITPFGRYRHEPHALAFEKQLATLPTDQTGRQP